MVNATTIDELNRCPGQLGLATNLEKDKLDYSQETRMAVHRNNIPKSLKPLTLRNARVAAAIRETWTQDENVLRKLHVPKQSSVHELQEGFQRQTMF